MSEKLKVLDLFSGIGGFSLGLERTGGFKTVAFCEIEDDAQNVLKKHWPDVPCFSDVRTLKGSDIGAVDVICGGYPCQPFSKSGKRKGSKDPRHLWPEFNRLVEELRPAWVIGENVSGHINMGLDQVLSDLEGQDYSTRAFAIPASGVDAPHQRERIWIIAANNDANSHSQRPHRTEVQQHGKNEPHDGKISKSGPICEVLADTRKTGVSHTELGLGRSLWKPEPSLGRMAHGVSRRVDRIRGLGNSVVPQIPERLGRLILQATETT